MTVLGESVQGLGGCTQSVQPETSSFSPSPSGKVTWSEPRTLSGIRCEPASRGHRLSCPGAAHDTAKHQVPGGRRTGSRPGPALEKSIPAATEQSETFSVFGEYSKNSNERLCLLLVPGAETGGFGPPRGRGEPRAQRGKGSFAEDALHPRSAAPRPDPVHNPVAPSPPLPPAPSRGLLLRSLPSATTATKEGGSCDWVC